VNTPSNAQRFENGNAKLKPSAGHTADTVLNGPLEGGDISRHVSGLNVGR